MNEAETRAEQIDPKLSECGWDKKNGAGVKVHREFPITAGKIQAGGKRGATLKADYVLEYKGIKLAAVEAKSDDLEVGEGVAQAKLYAEKLNLETTYATNGKEIYSICMKTGKEGLVDRFLSPEELWLKTFPPSVSAAQNSSKNDLKNVGVVANLPDIGQPIDWWQRFAAVPFEDINKTKMPRFYQEIAVQKVLKAVVNGQDRILLTLATGTGKTTIAFHIAWKLYETRWNLRRDGTRRPRILFLADRNILSDQAYGEFSRYSAFQEDALLRISPKAIREINEGGKPLKVNTFLTDTRKNKVRVPTNGHIFFTIFQTFMTGAKNEPNFGEYPKDFFDFIIIDECHRGGANDESNWRDILAYFSPAVQLGLTATPKRKLNANTYKYFGDPVYTYSLKEGINDGFLTPFKVQRIKSTLDDYVYTSEDNIQQGQVEEGKLYQESDFNRIIEIKEREKDRVLQFLSLANPKEKTIIFCANQPHAALIRDLVNQNKDKNQKHPNYCVRVTANDGSIGEEFLRAFQDNEKTIPTILTTSQKLSTGVDARNIRNIVLLRPVNSIIEFKQIVGRGTRVFEGKEFFTIYDFVNAYERFNDKEWDGPPEEETCKTCTENPCICDEKLSKPCEKCHQTPCACAPVESKDCEKCGKKPCICKQKVKIKLRNGKDLEIQHTVATSYWSEAGKPVTITEFLENQFGKMPDLFKNEEELRILWGHPITRRILLEKLDHAGLGKAELKIVQNLINAEKSDLFDVLEFLFNAEIKPVTREARVSAAEANIFALMTEKQKEFIAFVLKKYIETGVEELDQDKLQVLLKNKYQSLSDASAALGDLVKVREVFIAFQKHLYSDKVA